MQEANMITRELRINLFVGATAGLLGGALSLMLLMGHVVRAEDPSEKNFEIIRAGEFQLADKSGQVRAMLAFSADGNPYMTLLDRNGTRIVWLGLSEDSGLAARDADGKTRLVLSLNQAGEPSLVIRDRQHRMRSFHVE
jgi:hypothetical protein